MNKRFFCPGYGEVANGMSVVADIIEKEGLYKGFFILHGAWNVKLWIKAFKLIFKGKSFIRVSHGSYSRVAIKKKGKIKKHLVKPLERFLLRRAAKVIVTCDAERNWVHEYEPKAKVEMLDLKKFFKVREGAASLLQEKKLKVLYIGRRHPLKGVHLLESAIKELAKTSDIELRIATNAKGEEKDFLFNWCDVVCLPTLTENFGLAIAEARAYGKLAITTDGAPAWENEKGVIFIKGFVDASDAQRVKMLIKEFSSLIKGAKNEN
ncbi:MAG: glycosyltransferase family 4 protein [Kiritimatiellae bacterium]|nr:glycosyltransferase family 4 protein [Kiritimatiellia bacterium]